MFERVKSGILRDMTTAAESKYTDGPRDALVQNYLLLQVCEHLEAWSKPLAFKQSSEQDMKAAVARALQAYPDQQQLILTQSESRPVYRHLQEAQTHDGIMVALFLSKETAQALAIPGGEDVSDLHITLCYLGKVSEFGGDIEELKATVAKFIASEAPMAISGNIGGVGRFTPSDSSDSLSPVVALVNMPGLQEWRRRLVVALDSKGRAVSSDFDFLPHITLAYIDPTAPMPVPNIKSLPLAFDTLWLCIGDERIPYQLSGPLSAREGDALSDQTYFVKTELLDEDGHTLEPTNPQSIEAVNDGKATAYQEEGSGETGEIPESDRIPASAAYQERGTHQRDNATQDMGLPLGAILEVGSLNQESPTYFKAALAGITAKAIRGASPTGAIEEGHLTNGIAQLYLEAQRYSYNKAMATAGIKVAQEGIIGGIARGINATFDQALSWAKEQVSSIVSTLRDHLKNFIDNMAPDIDDAAGALDAELVNYASWKAPQIANVAWSTGADLGINAAIDDLLEATDPDLPGLVIDNMRVRVLPETSSGDFCKDYAGQDWSLADYDALGVSWPAHPGCPHYADLYIDNGSDAGDEML